MLSVVDIDDIERLLLALNFYIQSNHYQVHFHDLVISRIFQQKTKIQLFLFS